MKTQFQRHYRALFAAACLMGSALAVQAQTPSAGVQALLKKHYGGYAAGGHPGETFAQTTLPTWSNCAANGASCQTRDELVGALEQGLHKLIPDMRWDILEMMSSGNKIIVRGQGSGTPVGPFMGVPATGKRFQIMSIDIHTIQNGKIAHTYHLEDWAAAQGQLSGR